MISTIVVGTDGSHTARRAMVVAADLARRLEAELHVVHGYHVPEADLATGVAVAVPTVPVWLEVSQAVLDEALADPAVAGVPVARHSVPGAAAQALLDVAVEVTADLIVVGNRGMRGPRWSDSVGEVVAQRAPCHVLIAKTT